MILRLSPWDHFPNTRYKLSWKWKRKKKKMEIGNHNLDCHCSLNFYHTAIFETQIDSIRIKFFFVGINSDNSFGNTNGLRRFTITREIIWQMVE